LQEFAFISLVFALVFLLSTLIVKPSRMYSNMNKIIAFSISIIFEWLMMGLALFFACRGNYEAMIGFALLAIVAVLDQVVIKMRS
jgi:uncharacterized RDD family membrane protein YckC